MKILLASLIAITFLSPSALSQPIKVPQACYPKEYGTDLVRKATHLFSIKDKRLYHFFYFVGHRGSHGIVAMQQLGNQCEWAWSDPGGEGASMALGMPKAVAISAAKALVKDEIRVYKRESVELRLSRGGTYPPEFHDAYKSEGFDVSRIKTYPYPKMKTKQ
jgi:hypothetical protein